MSDRLRCEVQTDGDVITVNATGTLTMDTVVRLRAVLNKAPVPELGETPLRQPEIEAPEPVITEDEYDRHRFDHESAATKQ